MRVVVAAVLVALASSIAEAAMCHGSPSPDAQQNTNPINTAAPVFVKSVPNGKLFNVGAGDDVIPLVHLWGTPYQKGYAHGQLLADRAKALVDGIWQYLEDEVESALNTSIIPPEIRKW